MALVLENMEPDILEQIKNHISGKDQSIRGYYGSYVLLIRAVSEIETLRNQITEMEKAFLLTKTHD